MSTMAKKKLRPGKGAIGLILVRFIVPQQPFDSRDDRTQVVLIDRYVENEKLYFTFTYEGDDSQQVLHASARYVKILKEGEISELFDPIQDEDLPSQEPKIKWKKSRARSILYNDVQNGIVPITPSTGMKLNEIYAMHPEYAEYSYEKFSSRLSSICKTVSDKQRRSESDEKALMAFIDNHPVSKFSHKGYEEWQGSTARTLLLEDMEADLHLSLGKKELYASRPEYYEEFPLAVFRDKVNQEIRTGKYLHTVKVKGKQHKSS
jgi:hypothetical protein